MPFEQSSNGINATHFKLFNTFHHDKQPPEVVTNINKTPVFCQGNFNNFVKTKFSCLI